MTDAAARATSPANDTVRARAVQLAVIAIDGTWRILTDGETLGRFARQVDAVDCAADIAEQFRLEGRGVEVLLQDAFGEVRSLSAERAARAA